VIPTRLNLEFAPWVSFTGPKSQQNPITPAVHNSGFVLTTSAEVNNRDFVWKYAKTFHAYDGYVPKEHHHFLTGGVIGGVLTSAGKAFLNKDVQEVLDQDRYVPESFAPLFMAGRASTYNCQVCSLF
jgi:hypothetical protein